MKVRNLYISPVVFITCPCSSISAAEGKSSVFSDQAGEARTADRVRADMIRFILVVLCIFIPFNNGTADEMNDITEY